MSDDQSYPYPPDLRDLLKRRQQRHQDEMADHGWNPEADHLVDALGHDRDELDDEVVDLLVHAFEMGTDNGMKKMAHLANRHCASQYTELRFTNEASLADAVTSQYSTHYDVHALTEHADGTATVSLSRTWTELGDDGIEFYRIEGGVEEPAAPYRDGYVVDFGDRPTLLTRFENKRYHNPECVEQFDPEFDDQPE